MPHPYTARRIKRELPSDQGGSRYLSPDLRWAPPLLPGLALSRNMDDEDAPGADFGRHKLF